MALYNSAMYRAGYEGFFAIGAETSKLTANDVSLPSAPTLNMVAYADNPQISVSDNVQGVEAVAAYRDVSDFDGPRVVEYRTNILMSATIPGAGPHLLNYALRGYSHSGVTTKKLPLISVGAGALSNFDSGAAYTHLGRQAVINSISLQYGEGQPVRAALDIMPTCRQVGSTQTFSEPSFGYPLTWNDFDFTINGTSYRNIIASAGIVIANNVQRRGVRPNYSSGSTELSRCPYALIPGVEKLQVQITTHDKLPDAVRDAVNTGNILFVASGLDVNGTLRTLTVTIQVGRVVADNFGGGGPSAPFAYSVPIYTRGISISYS